MIRCKFICLQGNAQRPFAMWPTTFERGKNQSTYAIFRDNSAALFRSILWLLLCAPVTIDEELALLEDSLRRLKIEFDVYFAGASKKPPVDTDYRVQTLIRRNIENSHLTFPQRFRLNAIAHKYTVFSDLWRRKAKIKDEGYRRPQDTLLGVGGFGHLDSPQSPSLPEAEPESFLLFTTDVIEVVALYEAVVRAREIVGQPLGAFDSFASFVQKKSNQIRTQFNCQAVEYTVMVKSGQVQLKARARKDI
jgi:hypothetical protein